jgi:3-methyladenine DNA glycosylase AlkD
MPAKTTRQRSLAGARTPIRAPVKAAHRAPREDVQAVLSLLERLSTRRDRENLVRFGITAKKAFGVSMANIQVVAKRLGHDHELAAALWDTGWYEARLLTSFVDDPSRVTSAQMDRWCRDFDNWGIVDTACFVLFDRTEHAFAKIETWSKAKGEFQKRAAFALLACVALHDKKAPEGAFTRLLPLAEAAAGDERNFVKKGVVWALRGVGGRSPQLTKLVLQAATRLAESPDATPRWVGKTVLREMTKGRRGL